MYTAINIFFPTEYKSFIYANCKKYNIEPALIYSMIKTESHFNPKATSNKGAKGLMQITDQTAQWVALELGIDNFETELIYSPDINIDIGCWYINKLINQFDGDITLALAAYNAGSGNVSKWLDNKQYSSDGKTLKEIPFKETREYINKINNSKAVYKILLSDSL